MLDQAPTARPWLDPLVSACQRIAGDPGAYHSLEPLTEVVASLPVSMPPPERLILRSVVSPFLGRLLRSHDAERCAGFRARLAAWAEADLLSERWRDDMARVVASWDHAPCDAAIDSRVQRAVDAIHVRFKEPDLRLQSIASHTNLSTWYVAKLLKRQTGRGFLAHLHEIRDAEARRLLRESPLSIKEVAAAVGSGASEFGRRFKRVYGLSPKTYRRQHTVNGSAAPRIHDE